MGSFGGYRTYGSSAIPADKKEWFTEAVMRILYYGGMMDFEGISMYEQDLALLKPVGSCSTKDKTGEKVYFYYNYFEDSCWETASYNPTDQYFASEKIGSREFADVILAVYLLEELCSEGFGMAQYNADVLTGTKYVGWINHLLGTDYSMAGRFDFFENMEKILLSGAEDFGYQDARKMIPSGLEYAAGGRDFADLMYIKEGTEELEEMKLEQDTYPADVLRCRRAVQAFLGTNDEQKEERIRKLHDLLTQDRKRREQTADPRLKEVAENSLILPARVLAYLAAEIAGRNFWQDWKELHDKVYRDEVIKAYVSAELEAWRRQEREKPIPSLRTSEFLHEDEILFLPLPDEAKKEPDYVLTDDDRLYWWDGTDEVIISEETEAWLQELSERHKQIMEANADAWEATTYPMKDFMDLLVDIEYRYKRVYPFQDMFYEFQDHLGQLEYRAALELLRQLAEENWEKGRIAQNIKRDWDITSRRIVKNIGRLRMKRYLAVVANKKLRAKYFGF